MDRKTIACTLVSILLSSALVWFYAENSRKDQIINKLNVEVQDLTGQKSKLEKWLQENISRYEDTIASLTSEINELNTWLTENISYYKQQISDLNTTFWNYVSAYWRLSNQVNWRWMQEEVEGFITPEDEIVESLVYNITGGWSDPDDWTEFWTDVKAMYDWVVENIEYRYDGLYPVLPDEPNGSLIFWKDMWQLPNETLELKEGDCEDMAILLCSMIRAYGNREYYAEAIMIVGEESAHVAVQIPVSENEIVILDPAGHYYTKDFFGNLVPKDIVDEIYNWLDYWREWMRDVYVYRVFSDYVDIKFNSTSEYISWMYERD